MDDISIRDLREEEHEDAVRLLGRAFRDLPTTRAIMGGDAAHRMRVLQRGYRIFLPQMNGRILSAWRDDALVGVCGMQGPGECKLSPRQMMRVAPWIVFGGPPSQTYRCLKVFRERDRRDSPERHIHVEPIAIEPAVAKTGVGKVLGAAVCAEADRQGAVIFGISERFSTTEYLAKFGVEVVDEFDILGVPSFALRRAPQPPRRSGREAAVDDDRRAADVARVG
jgi:hypothetical protein